MHYNLHCLQIDYKGATWVRNEVRHGHFKSCRSSTWAFMKTVETDIKVFKKVTWGHREKIKSEVGHSINYLDPYGALLYTCPNTAKACVKTTPELRPLFGQLKVAH